MRIKLHSKINDLTASQWLFRSKSVMKRNFGRGKHLHDLRRKFNKSCKPPELCRDIVENLSKSGDVVFDPFAGTGGVLMGAQMAGRKAVGCEIDPEQVDAYGRVCLRSADLFVSPYDVAAIKCADFFKEYEPFDKEMYFGSEFVHPCPQADMILTDPPWFNLDERRKSSRWWKGKGSTQRPMLPYGTCHFDTIDDWKKFMARFGRMARLILKPGKYMAFFMEDAYLDGEYVFLTHISSDIMKECGFIPQGEWIWYNEARRACFFGFPSKMITSRTHTSVLYFLNPKEDENERTRKERSA